jgi:hypothetical protein
VANAFNEETLKDAATFSDDMSALLFCCDCTWTSQVSNAHLMKKLDTYDAITLTASIWGGFS